MPCILLKSCTKSTERKSSCWVNADCSSQTGSPVLVFFLNYVNLSVFCLLFCSSTVTSHYCSNESLSQLQRIWLLKVGKITLSDLLEGRKASKLNVSFVIKPVHDHSCGTISLLATAIGNTVSHKGTVAQW